MTRSQFVSICLATTLGVVACSSSSSTSPKSSTQLETVAPAGGATGVSVTTSITLHFSAPMMMTADSEIVLHVGNANGPPIPCTKSWSPDSMALTMTPTVMLDAGTHYTLVIESGMMDAEGHSIDMTTHGMGMGGQCMGGGMMGGGECADGMEFGFTTS